MTPQGIDVRVIIDGVYNDPNHKAHSAFAGDIITVYGGEYAAYLINEGFIEPVDTVGAVVGALNGLIDAVKESDIPEGLTIPVKPIHRPVQRSSRKR